MREESKDFITQIKEKDKKMIKNENQNQKRNFTQKLTTLISLLIQSIHGQTAPYWVSETTPVESQWLFEDVHSIPSNTEGIVVSSYMGIYYPNPYTYPTTWTTVIDPILRIKLNTLADVGTGFTGDEMVTLKIEAIFVSGYVYHRLVLEIKDQTGVVFSEHSYIDQNTDFFFNEIKVLIYIKTNPFEVFLTPSALQNDYYKTSLRYKSSENYHIQLKDAAEMRIGIVTPFPDFNNFPYGSVFKYWTTFYGVNQPYSGEFDRRYREDLEKFYFEPLIPEIKNDIENIHEFDMTPRGDFNSENYEQIVTSNKDYNGLKKYLQCVGGCKFVKNPKDQSYQIYLNENQMIKIVPDFKTLYSGTFYETQWSYLSMYERRYVTYFYWFKVTHDPGIHLCDKRSLIYNIGVHLTLDLGNSLYVNDQKTELKIIRNNWYAIGVSTIRDIRTPGANYTLTRVILQDLQKNETKMANVESYANNQYTAFQRFGGPQCGVEAFLKFSIVSRELLAEPEESCPFLLYNLNTVGFQKSCVFDEIEAIPDNLKVYDEDINMNRRDFQDCKKLEVRESGKCSCSPGSTLVVDSVSGINKCSCNNKTQYYDFKRWSCQACPVNHEVKENEYECQKVENNEVQFVYQYLEKSSQLKIMFTNSTLPGDFIEAQEEGKLKSRFEVEIPDKKESKDFRYNIQFGPVEQKESTVFLNFEYLTEMDYTEIKVRIFSTKSKIKENEATFKTGPNNGQYSAFGSVAEKVSPESVEVAENTIVLASIFMPSLFEKMPFILFFFSFLRTLNYYPVKIPQNLHKFLSLFYTKYTKTYGYTIINTLVREAKEENQDYFIDPPKLKIKNRHDIYISRVLYFSNTIPIISIISKIGLLWYLVKVFRQLKTASITKISKIEQEKKNQGWCRKATDFIFRKIITFMIIKIHIDIYGRLVFIFAAFGGLREVMNYNKYLCFINIGEALLDFTVIVWVEIKIYTFLKGSKAVQLLMLDVQKLKSVLMVNIFKMGKGNSHSAYYLCIQNLCIFFLASTLIVFQNFPEMLFFVHISVMLFLISYCFLMKDNFKYKIDFFIYFSNNMGFGLIVIMFSFFMYYEDYEAKTVALFGFLIQIGIILLMISKTIFLSLKFIRMYLNWREMKRKGSLVKDYVKKNKSVNPKKKDVLKNKGKKQKPPTFDELGNITLKKGESKESLRNGSNSQLFRFVMSRNLSKNYLGSLEEEGMEKVIESIEKEDGEVEKEQEDKLKVNNLSAKLRRGSIRSKRSSIMFIKSNLKINPPTKSKLGSNLGQKRKRKRSKSQIISPRGEENKDNWNLNDGENKRKKSSLKEFDDNLFAQLQKIHDDELKKREPGFTSNNNKINSKGTFSSHSSEYLDDDAQIGKNSIIENTLKLSGRNSPDHVSPIASPKNKMKGNNFDFKLTINGVDMGNSKEKRVMKFAPSMDNLQRLGSNRAVNIVKKARIANDTTNSLAINRKKRLTGVGLNDLKERIQLRRGSLRLNFKDKDLKEGKSAFNSYRGKDKHSTFSNVVSKTMMNEEDESPVSEKRNLALERTPSPSSFRRNLMKSRFAEARKDTIQIQELENEDNSDGENPRIDSVIF